MACVQFANFAFAELAQPVGIADTTIYVTSTSTFYFQGAQLGGGDWFYLRLTDANSFNNALNPPAKYEFIKVTAVNYTTNALTAVRAADYVGASLTAPQAFDRCDYAVATIDAKVLYDLEQCVGGGPATPPSVQVITTENLFAADPMVNLFNSGGNLRVRNANATAYGKRCNGYILTNYASGATATVYIAPNILTGLSGITVGEQFLAASAGAFGTTRPASAGNVVQSVGFGLSASSLDWFPYPEYLLPVAATFATVLTIDLSLYPVPTLTLDTTLTNNFKLNYVNGFDGQIVQHRLLQDGSGNRLVTYDTNIEFGTDITSAFCVLSTAGGALDAIGLKWNAAVGKAQVYAFVHGYT